MALIRCKARDLTTVTSRKIHEPQGYMEGPAIIGRCGIQEYLRSELGLDGDPNAVVRLMRLPEEVLRPQTIASFENMPITDDHPPEGVDADSWRELARGNLRDVGERAGQLLGGTTWVMDAATIERVRGGKVYLSCGYSFDLDLTPGTTPDGQAFDGYQRNILGDHLAIVDSPRGGPVCRIGDKQQRKESTMKRIVQTKDGLVVVGEFEEPQATTVQNIIDSLVGQRDKAVADLAAHVKDGKAKLAAKDTAITEKETAHKAAIAAKDKEIADLKVERDKAKAIDVDALVTEKTAVITDAKKLAPTLEAKGTSAQIRRAALVIAAGDAINKAVIDSHVGDAGIEKATDAQVKSAFDLLVKISRDAVVTAQDRAVAAAAAGNLGTNTNAVDGRAVVIDDINAREDVFLGAEGQR